MSMGTECGDSCMASSIPVQILFAAMHLVAQGAARRSTSACHFIALNSSPEKEIEPCL